MRVDVAARATDGTCIETMAETKQGRPRRARAWGEAASETARYLLSLSLFALLLYAVWEAATLTHAVQGNVLPTPLQVADEARAELASGVLLANTGTTLGEALGGFALGAAVAAVAGYATARLRALDLIVSPFIAAIQAVPAVAIAPLIIAFLGFGLWPKVLVCAVVVVFPLLITTITGLRGIERDYRDVARVFGASWLQTLRMVELPLAAPVLLSGLKLGVTLALVGAVVGEFVASDSGLGFMINASTASFQTAPRYVALLALALLSIILFGLVSLIERIVLRWQNA